jgi:RNA polymerase sigma-70 factor (ECF subfamily)
MSQPGPTASLARARFTEILGRTQSALYGYLRGLLGDGEDARDAVQDVYVDAWRQTLREAPPFGPVDDPKGVRTWLFHAAYCRAVSLLRHRRVLAWEPLDPACPPEPFARYTILPFEDRVVEGDALRRALAELDPDDAACLMLKEVGGFTAVEIARIAEVTPDAARQRLSRALKRLRAAYFAQAAPAQERRHP